MITWRLVIVTCVAFWVFITASIANHWAPKPTKHVPTEAEIHPPQMRCIPWKYAAEFHDTVRTLTGCPEILPREDNT